MVKDGEAWKIGFLVDDEKEGFCTVFIADAPRHDAREILIFASEYLKHIPIPSNKMMQMLKSDGNGSIDWVIENKVDQTK